MRFLRCSPSTSSLSSHSHRRLWLPAQFSGVFFLILLPRAAQDRPPAAMAAEKWCSCDKEEAHFGELESLQQGETDTSPLYQIEMLPFSCMGYDLGCPSWLSLPLINTLFNNKQPENSYLPTGTFLLHSRQSGPNPAQSTAQSDLRHEPPQPFCFSPHAA